MQLPARDFSRSKTTNQHVTGYKSHWALPGRSDRGKATPAALAPRGEGNAPAGQAVVA